MSDLLPGARLRQAAAHGTLAIPGVFSALVARLAARNGFRAGYLSGAALSAGTFALPDIGLFTLTELAQHTTLITRATPLPLIVDADTGFGEALNVERTVIELIAAGAAGIQLEDQQLPKRCGHLSGKSLVDTETMCAKVRSAARTRGSNPMVILARTDARDVLGLDDAIDRAKRYVDAGADWIFPEALETRDEFVRFAREVPVPLVANMTEFGKSPLMSLEELSALGFAAVLFPVTLLRVAMRAVDEALRTLAATGSQKEFLPRMQTRQELYDLLGYTDFLQRDQQNFSRQS